MSVSKLVKMCQIGVDAAWKEAAGNIILHLSFFTILSKILLWSLLETIFRGITGTAVWARTINNNYKHIKKSIDQSNYFRRRFKEFFGRRPSGYQDGAKHLGGALRSLVGARLPRKPDRSQIARQKSSGNIFN